MHVTCPVCKRQISTPTHLATHIRAKHKDYLAPEPKRKGPSSKHANVLDQYDQRKANNAARNREISKAGRNITIPPVMDPERRARCSRSLLEFCRTYYPNKFYLPFSATHLRVIARAEKAVKHGGMNAIALPRGDGKSTICKCAVVWAVLNGYRRFAVLVAATDELAVGLMSDILFQFETNDLLFADYPEVCAPIRALDRIVARARGQLYENEPTRLEVTASKVRLAQLPGSISGGAIIRCEGLTGAIRGMTEPGIDGEDWRPDLALIDDPQTRQSAHSPTQVQTRMSLVMGDVLGLAGPSKKIAALLPCTVIAPGDLAEQFLDRQKYPQWQGELSKRVDAFPTNTILWEKYFQLRDDDLRADGDGSIYREFYRANRQEMDAGASLPWPERYDRDLYDSAVEEVMCERHYSPESFAAEMQNEPLVSGSIAAGTLSAGVLADKSSGLRRGICPSEAQLLTLGIDVQKNCLFYTITAWSEGGGGSVIEYGVFPKQNRLHFRAADARPSLADQYPEMDETARIYAGLKALTETILGKTFPAENGGELRVEQCLIDSGWNTDLILQFVRQSRHATVILPSKGYGIGASSQPMSNWTRKPGQKAGAHWVINPTTGTGRGRQCAYDSNFWKSSVANRLLTPPGGAGCLMLPAGDNGSFIDHLTAEYRVTVAAGKQGRAVDEWKLKLNRDNHYLDTLVLAAVAASVRGIHFDAAVASGARATPEPRAQRRPVLDLAELQRAERALVGGRRR